MPNVVDAILREYPYPIAKCYERLVGASSPHERWDTTRYLLEATLKYCACIAISRYLHNDDQDDKTNAALASLNRPSLGHWVNLLIRCASRNQHLEQAFIEEGLFAPTRERPLMAEAHRAMHAFPDRQDPGAPKRITITRFFECFVAYRNRTAGHGAPSMEHIETITPILEEAAVDVLMHLHVLKEIDLLFIDKIHLDRNSCVHSIIRLMGTTPIAVEDHVTSIESALIGHDRKLFLAAPGEHQPFVSLHPLAIYSGDQAYLLHRSDMKTSVDYICHHTGQYYSADRILEDFKDAFGSILSQDGKEPSTIESEQLYEQAYRMSLIDGVLTTSEQQYLAELKDTLGIPYETTESIENRIRDELAAGATLTVEDEDDNDHTGAITTDIIERAAKLDTKRVLFVSYASVRSGFWADLVSRLAGTTHTAGNMFSMVAPDPSTDYDAGAMANLIADMDQIITIHQPDIILLVPYPSITFTKLFQGRFRHFHIPLITLDTEFLDLTTLTKTGGFNRPPAIHVDNFRGGQLAAEALLRKTQEPTGNDRYLMMPGFEHASHSAERIRGFTTYFEEHAPECQVRILPEGQFNRSRADRIFMDFLEDVDLNRFKGIFCGNDEMALGVFRAVNAHLHAKGVDQIDFHIAGFNKTVEVQTVMEADERNVLIGSVDQSLNTYTAKVFETIDLLMSGKDANDLTLIEPTFHFQPTR